MYFDNIFSNYANSIQSFIDTHKLSLVGRMTSLRQQSYVNNYNVENDHSFFIGYDIKTILMELFKFDSLACASFISLINDFNSYFFNKDKMRNLALYKKEQVPTYFLENTNAIFIKKSIDSNGVQCLQIMSLKSDILIDITKQGVIVKPAHCSINQQLTPIADDISSAVIQAVDLFRKQIAIITGFDYPEVKSSNIDQFKSLTLSSTFNANTRHDMFTYPNKDDVFNAINLLNYQNSVRQGFCAENNLMLVSNNASFFIDIIKNHLNNSIFEKFITAFNLHHNYQALISKKYIITMNFSESHPMDFERAFFDISFGDFAIVFSNKNESNNFHIFTIKDNINKTTIYSNDLSELFDLVYSTVNSLLIDSMEKSLSDMSFKDCEVFMMQNI